jgi:hypothetical protein
MENKLAKLKLDENTNEDVIKEQRTDIQQDCVSVHCKDDAATKL